MSRLKLIMIGIVFTTILVILLYILVDITNFKTSKLVITIHYLLFVILKMFYVSPLRSPIMEIIAVDKLFRICSIGNWIVGFLTLKRFLIFS